MDYRFDTLCVHGAYRAESGQPNVLPIAQSTTYRYYNTDDVAALFDLTSDTHMYSRISNPTVSALESKMALLEGGVAAVATASGQSATLIALLGLCGAGDHILASSNLYGGTNNLVGVTFEKLGLSHTFIDQESTVEQLVAAARPNTKALLAETLGNPALSVLDFDVWSRAAKAIGVPLIVDNTLATPYLCRPLEHGADVVIHSTTKYADGHGTSVGGVVVDGGRFDWTAGGRYPGLTEPDASYHGLRYTEAFGPQAYAVKLRAQLLRDFGCVMAPMNAWLTHMGLETLHLRMERQSQNALGLARYLETHPKVAWVRYPGLKGDRYYALGQRYMPKGAGGVLTFGVQGGFEAGRRFIEALTLTCLVVHVGDLRTMVLHPASATHRQLSETEQIRAGVSPELIRASIGIEDIGDILGDFEAALSRA